MKKCQKIDLALITWWSYCPWKCENYPNYLFAGNRFDFFYTNYHDFVWLHFLEWNTGITEYMPSENVFKKVFLEKKVRYTIEK